MTIVTIPGKNYDSNIYICTGKNPTLIDTGTGLYSKEIGEILQKILHPTTVTQIILTHEHFDHVGGVLDFVSLSSGKAKIFAHKETIAKLKTGSSSFAELLGGSMPKITVDVALHGGEQLMLGDEQFEVLYTPGHSKGSICLYSKTGQSLFSGDTIFAHGDYGRYDLPGGNFQELVSSITRVSSLPIRNLYPGHGDIVEGEGNVHVKRTFTNIHGDS